MNPYNFKMTIYFPFIDVDDQQVHINECPHELKGILTNFPEHQKLVLGHSLQNEGILFTSLGC